MAVNPVFDLGEDAFKDYSIENLSHYRILENQNGNQLNNKDTDSVKSLRFRVDDMNNWLNMGRSYIRLQGQFRKENGTGYIAGAAGAKAFLNNAAAIFRRCTLKANGITVENAQDNKLIDVTVNDIFNNDSEFAGSYGPMYNYFAKLPSDDLFLEGGELTTGKNAIAGVGIQGSNRHSSSLFVVGGTENPANGNSSLEGKQNTPCLTSNSRKTHAQDGTSIIHEVFIPLNKIFHILKAHDKIVRGIQWEIELEFDKSEKIICFSPGEDATGHNDAPHFFFNDRSAELYLERVLPRIEVRNVLNNLLLNGFKKSINYEDVEVRHQVLPSNTTNHDWRIATTVSRPTKLYLCAKWNHRDNAKFYNSQTFDYLSMKRVFVRVNGIKYPDEDYELIKHDNSRCQHGHTKVIMDLMKMKGLDVSEQTDMLNRGCLVTETNWNSHYPIYGFDLTKYPGDALFTGSSEIMVHIERDNDGTYAYNAKTATNGIDVAAVNDDSFTLYAVLSYEKVVELNMNQNESSIVIR